MILKNYCFKVHKLGNGSLLVNPRNAKEMPCHLEAFDIMNDEA